MAAVARPQSAGGSSSIKIALIVFVVLTVASLAGTIIILTNYSDMQAREADARNAAAQSDRRMQETQQQLERFAALVVGESTGEIPKIKQAMDEARGQVAADPALKDANLTPDTALVTMLRTLYTRFTDQGERLAKNGARLDELEKEREQIVKTAEATRKEFTDKTDELTAKYEQLEQASTKDREAWQQQVAALTAQLEKASEAAGAQLTAERQQRQAIAKERDDCQVRVKDLVATLASFRPQPDMASAMQIADGQIVRAVAGENIVYVSLGERDGLKRRITFAVYSRLGGIPADGKGKATILVEQVFETTAECKVTSGTTGDPIIEGDLVANPVFDKSRKLNFVVAGEFDLNFDGKIDDPDGAQVADLIAQAGGSVVRKIDTRTDFVVLGAPPPLPVEGSEAASPEAQERAAKRAAERQAFEAVVQEAKALSIPALTRTQFLHFIGIKVPANASEDTIPG